MSTTPDPTKPDTRILTPDEVAEIESLQLTSYWSFKGDFQGQFVPMTWEQRDALCQTVRAAWANEARLAKEVVELREQLAQAHSDNERLALVIQGVEEREAAVCPEDVGFDEYIRTLQRRLETRPQTGYPWTGNEP